MEKNKNIVRELIFKEIKKQVNKLAKEDNYIEEVKYTISPTGIQLLVSVLGYPGDIETKIDINVFILGDSVSLYFHKISHMFGKQDEDYTYAIATFDLDRLALLIVPTFQYRQLGY